MVEICRAAEGALQRVLDLAEGQPQRRQLVAVDVQATTGLWFLRLLLTSTQPGHLAQLVEQRVVPLVEFVQVGVLQGVLELGAGDHAADADRRRILQEDADARHGAELGPQAGDDLVGRLACARRAA